MSRQLAAFAGLCALGYFDLQLFGMSKVIYGNSEPAAGNLFNCAVLRIAVRFESIATRLFASFARIAHCAQAVHSDSHTFVRFFAYGTVTHRAGAKSFNDFAGGFDLFNRYCLSGSKLKKPP